MKENLYVKFPNLILKNIKTYFSVIFLFGSFSIISAQNPKANENATVYGGDISFADGETYTSFCVDGETDYANVILENASGRVKQWIITDQDRNIIGLPSDISKVDFDETGVGVSLIWHLSYNGIKPLVDPSGQGKFTKNLDDIRGRFSLSEPITVERFLQPLGGTLEGGPFEFCVGDGEADTIAEGAIALSGNMGTNSAWVITDADGNILDLPNTYSDVNFDEAPAGVCLVWHLSYEDNVSFDGVVNAADLTGCFALTNPIEIKRNKPEGGMISGGTNNNFDFTVGDGTEDKIPVDAITLTGNVGSNSIWVVTNEAGTVILGLPSIYSEVNFDGSGVGICKIWHLSYYGGLSGAEPPSEGDHLVSSLEGCFSLSNALTITKTAASTGKVSLFPNPAKGSVNINFSGFEANKINISVFDLKNVQISNMDYTYSNKRAELDISRFKNGIYFIRVTDSETGETSTKRLVVN